MRQASLYFAFFVLALALPKPVTAQDDPPCAKEIALFCSEAAPGQVAACLKEHEKELTPACMESLQSANKGRRQRRVRMIS